MNLLAVSIAPIYQNVVQGGSQRIFMDVMNYFSKDNHVRVFCTQRHDNSVPFNFNGNFEVYPVLGFRQFFPFPYMTNPKNLAEIIATLHSQISWADCMYVHADGFFFKKFFKGKLPLLSSLHDFVYPISMASAFVGDADRIIVPSQYVRDCVQHSVGSVYEDFIDRTVLITNGVNPEIFYMDNSRTIELRTKFGITEDELCLLFPHRPEVSKGIDNAIDFLNFLIGSGQKARLLFPKHIDLKNNPDLHREYAFLRESLRVKGLEDHVSFFEWFEQSEMRHIYSLADITLNLGNFVESFGLVPLESLLCGTPVIVTKAGCLRTNIPDSTGVLKIDYGDMDALVSGYTRLVPKGSLDLSEVRERIQKDFPFLQMLKQYSFQFLNAVIEPPLIERNDRKIDHPKYQLAPWCYIAKRGIYDDYLGDYVPVDQVLLDKLKSNECYDQGILGASFFNLAKQCLIVPIG